MSSKVLRRGLLKGAGRLFDGAASDDLGQPKRQLYSLDPKRGSRI